MTTEAAKYAPDDGTITVTTPAAGYSSGEVIQLADGRAGYVQGLRALVSGDTASIRVSGPVTLQKIADKVCLAGGRAYWDRSAGTVTPIRTADSFFCGTFYKDATAAATEAVVNLNARQQNQIELGGEEGHLFVSVATGTTPTATRDVQGFHKLLISSGTGAQCVDLLSVDSVPLADGPILEARINVQEKGDAAPVDIVWGLANGTSTTDADGITEAVLFSMNGNAADINAESDDGTTEVAATNTTADATEGTYQEFWIDARDPSDCHLYIDAVEVLASTTFDISKATGPLKALVLVEKTAGGAEVPDVRIDFLRVRSTDLAAQ
ncbi:MAG: hypothetical protein PHU85_11550 [Phycisphaerae bacterium]|nr:hypothetical protein [Phycisphaerae bacterium]